MNVRSAIHLALGLVALAALVAGVPPGLAADTPDPVADARAFQKFFTDKFPKVTLQDFVNGPYSMNEDMHRQWEEKEQFPPYEFALDMGKEMFSKPFTNGKSYADCFPNQGIGIRQNYPYFDEKEGKVVTLELALNRCRRAANRSTSRSRTIRARWRPIRTASAIFIRGAASSISPAPPVTCRAPASGFAPKCWRPRSGS